MVPATLRVLGYPADRRPFYAVHSGDRNEVEAWLALRDRPQDINQQMTTWLYTAFSLACEEGRCEIAEMLIEKDADTSLPNHVGETGLDIARRRAELASKNPAFDQLSGAMRRLEELTGEVVSLEELLEEVRDPHPALVEATFTEEGNPGVHFNEKIEDLTDELEIAEVVPGSQAASHEHVVPGLVVQSVDGISIADMTADESIATIENAPRPLTLTFRRRERLKLLDDSNTQHKVRALLQAMIAKPDLIWQFRSIRMKALLEKWSAKGRDGVEQGRKLFEEEQRNLSRPVQSVPKERPEIGIDRLGYWDAHHSTPSKQYSRFVKLNEGAYGSVTKVPVDIPVRDSSGKLHYEAAAKSTKASIDDSSDAGAAGSGTKNKSGKSSQAEAEVKALSSEIQTLHKLDRANYSPSS